MPDLNALLMFARLAEAGSYSEAARRLKMPVSTLSRRISELENELGVRLLDRSTRRLRLTEVGGEILEPARRTVEIGDAVSGLASHQNAGVSGLLRLASPPSISDTLLAPITVAFQCAYPEVRVEIMVTERDIDFIVEGVDLAFHVGPLKDSALRARRILRFRHLLVASPAYLATCRPPQRPRDLLEHRVLAFSHFRPEYRWIFTHRDDTEREAVTFLPHLGINDFAGVTAALLAGIGIGDLSPVVQPDLIREGRLVEVMPDWHFPRFDLSLIHLGNRHLTRPVRIFKDFASDMAPSLFPELPV